MTAEDRATAVQLVRATVADHLGHLEPAERDELVERISAAIERCALRREAAVLRAAADDLAECFTVDGWLSGHGLTAVRHLNARADALTRQREGL